MMGMVIFFFFFHFSQLLNVYGIIDIKQADVYTAGPLVPETGAFEV
jgi:hypothetical protein